MIKFTYDLFIRPFICNWFHDKYHYIKYQEWYGFGEVDVFYGCKKCEK